MRIIANKYAEVSRILANKHAEVSRILAKILLNFVSFLHSLIYNDRGRIYVGVPGTRLRERPNKPILMLLSRLKRIIIWLSAGNVPFKNEIEEGCLKVGSELINRRFGIEAEIRA